MGVDEAAVVYFEMPVVKHCADAMYSYLFTFDGDFNFDFRNLCAKGIRLATRRS